MEISAAAVESLVADVHAEDLVDGPAEILAAVVESPEVVRGA